MRCNPWTPPSPGPRPPPPSPPPPSPHGVACLALSGKGCATCIAATDDQPCPGHYCGQPCVHLSQLVGTGSHGRDCFPASWWAEKRSVYPKVTCTGNATGCQRTCSRAPPPPRPTPPPSPPPPSPSPGPLPLIDTLTATYLTDYPDVRHF